MAPNFVRKSGSQYDQRRPNAIGRERRTFGCGFYIVLPVVIALDVSCETNARLELALKDVALVEEQHEIDLSQ